jgi:hypothetical protein
MTIVILAFIALALLITALLYRNHKLRSENITLLKKLYSNTDAGDAILYKLRTGTFAAVSKYVIQWHSRYLRTPCDPQCFLDELRCSIAEHLGRQSTLSEVHHSIVFYEMALQNGVLLKTLREAILMKGIHIIKMYENEIGAKWRTLKLEYRSKDSFTEEIKIPEHEKQRAFGVINLTAYFIMDLTKVELFKPVHEVIQERNSLSLK